MQERETLDRAESGCHVINGFLLPPPPPPLLAVQKPNTVMSVFCPVSFLREKGTDLVCECLWGTCVHTRVCVCMCVHVYVQGHVCVLTFGRRRGSGFRRGLHLPAQRLTESKELESVLWLHLSPIVPSKLPGPLGLTFPASFLGRRRLLAPSRSSGSAWEP